MKPKNFLKNLDVFQAWFAPGGGRRCGKLDPASQEQVRRRPCEQASTTACTAPAPTIAYRNDVSRVSTVHSTTQMETISKPYSIPHRRLSCPKKNIIIIRHFPYHTVF